MYKKERMKKEEEKRNKISQKERAKHKRLEKNM
jgi:hypothetical protein